MTTFAKDDVASGEAPDFKVVPDPKLQRPSDSTDSYGVADELQQKVRIVRMLTHPGGCLCKLSYCILLR